MSKKELIIEEIRKIYDPELPVNIYELGLIYDVQVENDNFAKIKMTLTTPNCPVAESLPKMVKDNILRLDGVDDVDLKLVWDPPWTKDKIVSEIKKIYDPEIPVNIYELGLIYKIDIKEAKKVNIEMTLTSPNCPVAESLPKMVKDNILKLEGVDDVDLKLVWDPPWTKDKMSEAAKLELNL